MLLLHCTERDVTRTPNSLCMIRVVTLRLRYVTKQVLVLTLHVDVDVVCGRALGVTGLARVHAGLVASQAGRHRQHAGHLLEPGAERQLGGAAVPTVRHVGRIGACRHVQRQRLVLLHQRHHWNF